MSIAGTLDKPIPKRKAGSWARSALFSLLGLLLVALLIEGVAFIAYWTLDGQLFSWARAQESRSTIVATYDPDKAEQRVSSREVPHPYLGFVRNPDHLSNVSQFGYPKSTPLFTQRSEDRVVIAVVGGSVAFHFAKKGMPGVIEAMADSPGFAGKEAVVVNLAVGGYKQPQQLMTLNYLLALGFEFDIVVNLDGFNEVALYEADNGRKSVFPIYPRAWHVRMGGIPDTRTQMLTGRIVEREARIASRARAFSRFPWRYSVTGNLVWQVWHEKLIRNRQEAIEAFRTYEPPTSPYLNTGPRVNFQTEQDLYGHLVTIWQRSSLQIDQLCRANGIRYYHFLQPNQYVPGSKPLTTEERSTAFRENHPYRPGAEKGYPLLIAGGRDLAQRGVRFVDLTRLFEGEQRVIYQDDCCHVNEIGNLAIAREVVRAMASDRRDG